MSGVRLPVIALDPVSGMSSEAWPVRFPDIPPFAVIRPEAVRVPVTLTPVDVAVSMSALLTPK